jgi:hypothetical protein
VCSSSLFCEVNKLWGRNEFLDVFFVVLPKFTFYNVCLLIFRALMAVFGELFISLQTSRRNGPPEKAAETGTDGNDVMDCNH